jgi:hypothetical protein
MTTELIGFALIVLAIWAGGTLLCVLPSLPAVRDLIVMPWDGEPNA